MNTNNRNSNRWNQHESMIIDPVDTEPILLQQWDPEEQWKRLKEIDRSFNAYYRFMQREDYIDKNGNGKFIKHCQNNNLKPHEFDAKLYNIEENHIYTGWDDQFPFIFRINKQDMNRLMIEFIKKCRGCWWKNHKEYFIWAMSRAIGLERHKSYHIELDEYCGNGYNYYIDTRDINCKYCSNPSIYHEYLVNGYITKYITKYLVSDIVQIIILFLDKTSVKIQIMKRNNYLLSYWKKHQPFFESRGRPYGVTCINIYHDGTVFYHGNENMIMR